MMLRASEVAERLGIHKNTIYAMVRRGEIPAIRTYGGHYRFDYDRVVKALEESEEEKGR